MKTNIQVRMSPDLAARLDEYLRVLGPCASSRGDVVRVLMACATPGELREIVVTDLEQQIEEAVKNAEVEPQMLGRVRTGFVANADGTLMLPRGPVRCAGFGEGRTEEQARAALRHFLRAAYLGEDE